LNVRTRSGSKPGLIRESFITLVNISPADESSTTASITWATTSAVRDRPEPPAMVRDELFSASESARG
jgi:hypothetical protein